MAVANASTTFTLRTSSILPAASVPHCPPISFGTRSQYLPFPLQATRKRKVLFSQSCAEGKNEISSEADGDGEGDAKVEELGEPTETLLYSFSPLPMLVVAALPGGNNL